MPSFPWWICNVSYWFPSFLWWIPSFPWWIPSFSLWIRSFPWWIPSGSPVCLGGSLVSFGGSAVFLGGSLVALSGSVGPLPHHSSPHAQPPTSHIPERGKPFQCTWTSWLPSCCVINLSMRSLAYLVCPCELGYSNMSAHMNLQEQCSFY